MFLLRAHKKCGPIKNGPIKKKMFGPGLEPWVRDHYSAYGPIYPLVPQRSTVVSCNYHYYISTLCHYLCTLILRHRVVKRN